ncbi:isochorismatase family protein [Nocardia colli]|uniref:Isochorismatase family protein n=1 Tax=Nocardia colli TaxID=2545717 RepID=A0A5N0E130_9NOCA|nr:isochorismatase family protein [Nocardia colli]
MKLGALGVAGLLVAAAADLGAPVARADVLPVGSVGYPMANVTIPPQKVNWTPDRNRAALLVHDMQHYFVKIFNTDEPRTSLIGNTSRLLDCARSARIPVFYSAQPGGMSPQQRGLVADFSGSGMPDDDSERAIVPPLEPIAGDTRLLKHKYSEFFGSELLQLLRDQGRDQLILCGVYANTGVMLTATDAFQNDIQPFLISDALADQTEQGHQRALDWVSTRVARVLNTDSVIASLAH